MPILPSARVFRGRPAAGLERAPTPVLLIVVLSMSLSTWFFGNTLYDFGPDVLRASVQGLAEGPHTYVAVGLALAALAGIGVMTAGPSLLSIHVGAILEERFSPHVLPRLRRIGGARLFCIGALLVVGTPLVSVTAHNSLWPAVMLANEHGVRALLSWEILIGAGLAACALVSAAALIYLSIDLRQRMQMPSGPTPSVLPQN